LEHVDAVVIGAGAVGLAVARELALNAKQALTSIFVLEAHGAIGTQTSSRNSEVIHSGIYYPAHSLKARLCVQGRELLYDYLRERSLPFSRLGKLIVATEPGQLKVLEGLQKKALDNGVNDLTYLNKQEIHNLEPDLRVLGALLSPSTGILDSHAFMLSLQGVIERLGGHVVLEAPVTQVRLEEGSEATGATLTTQDGTEIKARVVVNAAGLMAPKVARWFHGSEAAFLPQAHYAKGNYFALNGRSPFKRLIYPVPQAAGLGVHLTLDLAGRAKFGPDVEWVEDPDDLVVDPKRSHLFYEAIRQYWPDLPDDSLVAGYSGIRPKINSKDEEAADFLILGPQVHQAKGVVHLLGIESPGLTSSLAIARQVVKEINAD
jgi:L-2-hydroxyglutarate oxidase LhgO